MARTKAPKKKLAANSAALELLKEALHQKEREVKQLTALGESFHDIIENKIDFIMFYLPHPEKPFKELKLMTNSTIMKTTCDNIESSVSYSTKKSVSAKKKRSLSCAPDDDGYITGDSASSRTTRTSRARSRAPLANSTARVSRSLSRTASQQLPKLNTKNKGFQTPAGKQPNNAYGMVTPKMQPNAPQLILRRPKHGEMAISMEGSPLMVNPVATDHIANVNIPLGEGRLLSLQPERGLRVSMVPNLDPETQAQLLTLSAHIQQICAASKRV
ncbi:uncharacterized protein [Atheta coriaria]|uniref:uncharacterized protein isoform X1 n=1 Tax=Dalotia coriaria TaxID=877792 RepID=UPI0031F3F3F2